MAEQFYKGRTNNHLTWVMVDSTDFATPESALSAATKIKIYGKLKSATGVNFVSSGTGSLTNDIQHVGASALGIYTIALAKADLSDASAAWYDHYVISLSATGAAYQTIIADGGIDFSALSSINSDTYSLLSDLQSDFQSRVPKRVATDSQLSDLSSDLRSFVNVMSGIQSDVYSALILTQSMASDAASAAQQTNSRVLLVQSRLSDFDSRLVSDISDIQSFLSDFASDMRSLIVTTGVNLNTSVMSDIRSAITAQTATVSASDISDIASAVQAIMASDVSDILSAARQTNSRVLVAQSMLSDVDSALTSQFNATSDAVSNVYSAITSNRTEPGQGTPGATIGALAKLDYLYKAWRNKHTQTATEYDLYADDGTTIDQKAAVSDDGTTFTRDEIGTGP